MLRLLIGASSSRLPYLEDLARSLAKFDVTCRIVDDVNYDGYPSTNFKSWFDADRKFKRLVLDFKPDAILADRERGFALRSVNSEVPTLIYLRGDYWSELEWAKKTTHKSFINRRAIEKLEKNGNECFSKAAMILPICRYVEKIVNKKHPKVPTQILQNFADESKWFKVKPMKLIHPCVGLLQMATVWKKAQEMMLLKKILPALPDIMFYWAGGGRYEDAVLKELKDFPNFKWLGILEYPHKTREYLAGLDVYALISGIDMSPASLHEAQLMEKTALATDVGGIPESIEDGRTGFLIPAGDSDEWVRKIKYVLGSPDVMKKVGESGRKFAVENFSPSGRAKDLSDVLKNVVRQPS